MKKLKVVPNAKNWHKWWSMRFIALSTMFSSAIVAYATIPHEWLPYISVEFKQWLAVGALVSAALAGGARVVQQTPKDEE